MKVFLGGTCNNSAWREKLKPLLTIDYFDPVVEDWDEEAQQREIYERKECDFCLYVITPLMTGTYAIAEVVDDSNKRPEKTIFCILTEDEDIYQDGYDGPIITKKVVFDGRSLRSLERVGHMISDNGGKVLNSLEEVANYLNGSK